MFVKLARAIERGSAVDENLMRELVEQRWFLAETFDCSFNEVELNFESSQL